jgi:hypothetical protein
VRAPGYSVTAQQMTKMVSLTEKDYEAAARRILLLSPYARIGVD